MVQYILRQRNQYSCGPIALLNALKWRGENATWTDKHLDCFGPVDDDEDALPE